MSFPQNKSVPKKNKHSEIGECNIVCNNSGFTGQMNWLDNSVKNQVCK